ncbi:MAG: NIPSNAP family containing protein [Luteitalea sp.]|nr:NIPSNAP family containing protein [Luteitalea sp.]
MPGFQIASLLDNIRCGIAVILCGVILLSASVTADDEAPSDTPIYQLRIYEIFEENKAAFHDRFRDHAARIMKKYDFKIIAMWESQTDARTEFVYLLEWPSREVLKDRWSKFMADEEWAEIKRETGAKHGTLVGSIQDRVLHMTDYSPRM